MSNLTAKAAKKDAKWRKAHQFWMCNLYHRRSLVATVILALSCCAQLSFAQAQTQSPKKDKAAEAQAAAERARAIPQQYWPPHPASKMDQRYFDIDVKRAIGISPEDMLPRSREFKRIDSTYYVGWMIEGMYKYDHAEDYLGFKNACVPLERALQLLEHDYAKPLATRTSDIMVLYPIRQFVPDYTMTAYYLLQCYLNTDQPDKAYTLLRRALKWKFQLQYSLDPYNYLAWIVHRNRFYTSAKYGFLKNSIDENEKLANRYLDTCLMQIVRNEEINKPLERFFPGYENNEKMGVYHYKNILYSYSFNIDSAMYYFNLMKDANRLPHNNFANFLGVIGDFKTADAEYKLAADQDPGDKRLREWAYYSTILDIYKASPKVGVTLARSMIKSAGTTPGYGWYNIALARCMLYDGQISEAEKYIDKAAGFKELHIGTTLGQSHYDFSVQLIKLMNKEQSWQMDRFEHRNWWYNPNVLLSMGRKLSEKYLQQFLIIDQFSQNPERDRVIYKLFSTESTVSWDEVWALVHDFSNRYFISIFKQGARADNRPLIRKYFALFVARLQMQQGKYEDAKRALDNLLRDPEIDTTYEKLFLARIYEAEANCAAELKNEPAKNNWLYRMYKEYPQLVPFTGLQMNMRLHISGAVDPVVEKRLRDCNINWVTSGVSAPDAYVQFTRNGNRKDITCYVTDDKGNYIVPKQSYAWQKADETGTNLAYRLFNIGGKETEGDE